MVEEFACKFLNISYSTLEKWLEEPRFSCVATRIREDCAYGMARALQCGYIPYQLSGLMLSRYGYKLPAQETSSDLAAALAKIDAINDKIVGNI